LIAAKYQRNIDLSSIPKILCIQMNAIGDTLMTQPAWAELKSHLPDSEIHLMCRPHIASLFRKDPALKTVVTVENSKFKTWCFKNSDNLKHILATKAYDLIIDFSALPHTAAICADPAVAPSIGFQRRMEGVYRKIDLTGAYDLSFPYSEEDHIRDLMLSLVSPWNHHGRIKMLPELKLAKDTLNKADNLMREKRLIPKGFIVMHPGAKWLPKRWPVSLWKALMKHLSAYQHRPILFLGGTDDKESIHDIQKMADSSSVHFMISKKLDISAAILKRALLCVCNDSAAMHIAAAVGTPSVSIFGPVSPGRSAPTPETGCTALYDHTFCSPCTLYYSRHRCRRGINFCMYGITPAAVAEAIESKL